MRGFLTRPRNCVRPRRLLARRNHGPHERLPDLHRARRFGSASRCRGRYFFSGAGPFADRGRAAARDRSWRPRDQCGDGARQGRRAQAARPRRADRRRASQAAGDHGRGGGGPRLHQHDARSERVARRAARGDRRRAEIRPQRSRQGREGQRRIRLGQSDRADACRPLPRRRVRRCAREPAGFHRQRRDPRILHQRRRRPGRRARPLRLPALPRGAG